MLGYTPVDLAAHQNAGADVFASPVNLAVGNVLLRGIPFRIGTPDGAQPYVLMGRGGRQDGLHLTFDRPVRSILVAHLLVDSQVPAGGPAEPLVADYIVQLVSGETIRVPVRELFEIGALAVPRPDLDGDAAKAWRLAMTSLLAVSDAAAGLHPRRSGPWASAGTRLMESADAPPGGYRIWVWRDQRSREAIALEINPAGAPFVIAGVTVGDFDEDPIVRTGREPLIIRLLDPAESRGDGDVALSVDRGLATYTWPVLQGDADTFLGEAVQGWGQPVDAANRPIYVEVAATPSATLQVRRADTVLGAVRWGDVVEKGAAEDPGRLRVEWVDRTRQWVSTTVVDEETGLPVPCRIHFRSTSGVPWQPHGHHNHVNGDLPSQHMDVGGDIRLGAVSYAVIDGRCEGWLPEGEVLVEAVRGFEYAPIRERVRIQPGQRELRLSIRRLTDLRREGWISGDTHVHFLSVDGAHLEAAAEDVHVVNLLQAQWGQLFTNAEDFTGHPSVSRDGETIVHVGQENRQHALGHLGLLGLRKPVMPWSSDGAIEAELGGTIETTLSHWADAAHAQGAFVTLPHFSPNGETAALIATDRIDAVEMISLRRNPHEEYYRYLNAGYRLPLVGGTDKMTSEVPVGICRTYVQLDPDEPFSYDAWLRNITRGRTFVTSGPLLKLRVEGMEIGDTVRLPPGGGTVEVQVDAESTIPFEVLQLVVGGRVVGQASSPQGARRLELRERVRIDADTWIAARAGGPTYYDARQTLCSFQRGVFAHTSPIYVATGAGSWSMRDDATIEYLLTRVEAARTYIRDIAPRTRLGGGGHPHGEADHLAYLERPFLEARRRLEARRAGGA